MGPVSPAPPLLAGARRLKPRLGRRATPRWGAVGPAPTNPNFVYCLSVFDVRRHIILSGSGSLFAFRDRLNRSQTPASLVFFSFVYIYLRRTTAYYSIGKRKSVRVSRPAQSLTDTRFPCFFFFRLYLFCIILVFA